MNPSEFFCPNDACPMRGLLGQQNIICHSRKEQRLRCLVCGRTFAHTNGTPFFRLRTSPALVTVVLTLLAHGCPLPAIVAAFGLDERTVAAWQARAGYHCEQVHRATVRRGQVDLEHVQADELWVKLVGRKRWLALALAVPTRLWLGGVISERRDDALIRELAQQVRRCARSLEILVCVDGFASYVAAFGCAFKEWLRTGQRGGPRKRLPAGFLLGQVLKSKVRCRVLDVAHRAVIGSLSQIEARLQATGGGQVINTAFVERFNATLRSRLVALVRRGRRLVRQDATLQAGVYLVGTVYNFCCCHASLRQEAPGPPHRRWQPRTPAMAAGLTDHCWSVHELLSHRVAPPPWAPPKKRRGRPPKQRAGIPWKLRPHRWVLCASTV